MSNLPSCVHCIMYNLVLFKLRCHLFAEDVSRRSTNLVPPFPSVPERTNQTGLIAGLVVTFVLIAIILAATIALIIFIFLRRRM